MDESYEEKEAILILKFYTPQKYVIGIYTFAEKYHLFRKFVKRNNCIWSDTEYRNFKKELRYLLNSCEKNYFAYLTEINKWEDCKDKLSALKKEKTKSLFTHIVNRIINSKTPMEYWYNLNFFRRKSKSRPQEGDRKKMPSSGQN